MLFNYPSPIYSKLNYVSLCSKITFENTKALTSDDCNYLFIKIVYFIKILLLDIFNIDYLSPSLIFSQFLIQ